ncbi:hypothetical protein PWT90_00858 [Aphanocladium album]|nr:hypothetical protein PWT90_00858 [Aphanocladium album]
MIQLSHVLLLACSTLAFPAPQTNEPEFVLEQRGGQPPTEPAYAPGDVIRARHPPLGIRFFGTANANLADSYQLLYRTSGPDGSPMVAVSTVMIPHNADYSKFLSYQVETDSPWGYCLPSVTLKQSLDAAGVVSSPDHEGPNGAVLDNLRAVLRARNLTGVKPDARIVLWGYSVGSHATAFALELAQEPSSGTGTRARSRASPSPARLGCLARTPKLKTLIDEELVPSKSDDFYKPASQCLIATHAEDGSKDLHSYFKDGKNFLNNSEVQRIASENVMKGQRGASKMPIFMYHAIPDEIVSFQDAQNLYNTWYAGGANIHFNKDQVAEHVTMSITSAPAALDYISGRLNGKRAQSGCQSQTKISSLLNLQSLSTLGQVVVDDISTFLGNFRGASVQGGIQSWTRLNRDHVM